MPRTRARADSVADRAATGATTDSPSADRETPAILGRVLQNVFEVRPAGTVDEVLIHLDTADGRLRRAGIDLVFDPHARRLRAHPAAGKAVEQSTEAIEWPAPASAIPDGALRRLISAPASIRALIPVARSETRTVRL